MTIFASLIKPMRRLPYILWSIALLLGAFLLLRSISIHTTDRFVHFPDTWQFLDPLGMVLSQGTGLWASIAIHLVLSLGLSLLAMQRSKDAGTDFWLGLLMLLPVIRLFVFTVFAILPSDKHTDALEIPRSTLLERMIPRSRSGSAVAAILIAVLVVLPLGFVNVRVLNDYGLALFIGLPFLLGATSAYLFNYHEQHSIPASLGLAMLTISLTLLLIFLFAMEGLLCLVMAAPLVYLIAIPGALIGHALSGSIHNRGPAMTLMVLMAPTMMAFEATNHQLEPEFKVVTSTVVQASPEVVWRELIAFSPMEEPDELLFRAGISYPVQARIEGVGVGAVRYCEFNTGPFVEPITVWNEPHLLAFDVATNPPPMTELTIYERIDAPHIEGFFHSHRGQFDLSEQVDGTVLLTGTTWYSHAIWPAWYWRFWSDAILHRIHLRVLEHIKTNAERE